MNSSYNLATLQCAGKPGASKKQKNLGNQKGGEPAKKLTGKKLEQALKREADKVVKQEAAAKKKEENEKKRAAATTSKKMLQLATKICGPLTNAWTAGADVLEKAVACQLPEGDDLTQLKDTVEIVDGYRKICSHSLNVYAKNNKCHLEEFPFDLEMANDTIKECQAFTKHVRKLVQDHKKKVSADKAAAKSAAAKAKADPAGGA